MVHKLPNGTFPATVHNWL